VRAALSAVAQPLPGVNWIPAGQLHLTLRFLGDVPCALHEAMFERLGKVAVAPFILPVEGLGTFPPNRPARVLWAGVGHGHPRLFQLRQRVDDALLAAGLELDVRTFQPHATLARCTESAAESVNRWLRGHRDFAAPPFRVQGFDVYASELRPGGAVHTLKRSFPLAE
jgi:2'-5' RNA ligase